MRVPETAVERIWIAVAGLSGMAGVAADAAARHLLAGDAYRLDLAATGARYGLLHAAVLAALVALRYAMGGSLRGAAAAWLLVSGWCFVAGIALFCGGLYALALGAPPLVGRVVPWGGTLFIAGWATLLIHAVSPRRTGR